MDQPRAAWTAPWTLVASGVLLGHALMPDGLLRDLLGVAVGAVAVAVVARSARRMSGRVRSGWVLLGCGLAAWVLGDASWTVLDRLLDVTPSPSVADVAYLLSYPLLAVGLMRAFPVPVGRRGIWVLDAFLLVGGVLLGLWQVVMDPAVAAVESGDLGSVIGALYPLGDAALLVVLVRPFVAMTTRIRAYRLTALSVMVILAADVLFQVAQTRGLDDHVYLLDSGWLVGYLLLAAAASRATRDDTGREPEVAELSPLHVGAIAVSSSMVPLTLVVAGMRGGRIPLVEVCTIGTAMLVSILVRFGRVVSDLRERNADLARLAVTDPLTGLSNATGLAERVEEPTGTRVPALLLISLGGYRDVVDTLGHGAADALLRSFAAALARMCPPEALPARMSRHVFAVALDVASVEDATGQARRLLDALGDVHRVGAIDLDPDAVAGLAVASGRPAVFAEVSGRADAALASAQRRHEQLVVDGTTPGSLEARGGALMPELTGAVERGELVVHYQVVARVLDGRSAAAEALVRWQHPRHGLLGPDAFVPAAERLGLIHLITRYVLDDALAVCARRRVTAPGFTVGVNVSAHDLDSPDLAPLVRELLRLHRLPASALTLEVTETMAMRDVPRAEHTLRALADLGVRLAVDDYGVGYGSLDYLRRLPFSVLKIDRVFVAAVTSDPTCAAIVASTISLGHALGMRVVAEGVEDLATLALLREMECDSVQGWALGRPVPAAELDALIGVDLRVRREASRTAR